MIKFTGFSVLVSSSMVYKEFSLHVAIKSKREFEVKYLRMFAIVVLCALAALTSASTDHFYSAKFNDIDQIAPSNDEFITQAPFHPKVDHFRPQDERIADFVSIYSILCYYSAPFILQFFFIDLHNKHGVLR